MKKSLLLATLSVFALAAAASAEDTAAAAPQKDYVILKVQGHDIKRSEVEDAWKIIFQGREAPPIDSFGEKMKDKFLREVATERVLADAAEKQGMADSPEVKATLEKIKRQVMIQQLLKDKTKDAVSDDKLKAAYAAHIKDHAAEGGEEIHARHILVKTKEEADDVEKKLKKGTDFEKLAKEKSEDKTSGASGGDLGWFAADKMLPDFSKAAFALKKNEISQPVKTDFGWHVIQLIDRRKGTPPSFDEVKEGLKQEAGNKAVSEYVKSIMTDVKITEVDAEGHEKPLPVVAEDKPAGKDAAAPAAKE